MKSFLSALLLFIIVLIPTTLGWAILSWSPEMERHAREIEYAWALPHGTCRSFARQESNYDQYATRVETGYFNVGGSYMRKLKEESITFLAEHPDYHITVDLERAQRSISHGMFQPMGENLRLMGYDKEYIDLTLDEQFYYFGKFAGPEWAKVHNLSQLAAWYNTGKTSRTGRSYDQNIVRFQHLYRY